MNIKVEEVLEQQQIDMSKNIMTTKKEPDPSRAEYT